jgi:hypothetical protein
MLTGCAKNNREWTEKEDKFIIDNYPRLIPMRIGEELNRSSQAVQKRRRFLGLQPIKPETSSGKKWSDEEDQVIIDNYKDMSCKELMSLIPNRTRAAIERRRKYLDFIGRLVITGQSSHERRSKEHDVALISHYYFVDHKDLSSFFPKRTKKALRRRAKEVLNLGIDKREQRNYDVDVDFFKEPNILNCYIAGFIAADGCLYNGQNKHVVSIILNAKDGQLLEEFKRHVRFGGDVDYYTTKEDYDRASLVVSGVKQWFNDLDKHFNIGSKKSLTLMPPNLQDENLIKAYIRGLIDGDGWLIPFADYTNNTWVLGLCGTKELLDWVCNLYDEWVPNTYYKKASPHSYKSIYVYTVSGKRSKDIIKNLLSADTPYLPRKWEVAMKHLK